MTDLLESRIGCVSVRGIIALTLVLSCCALAACALEIPKTLDAATLVAVTWYFSQKNQQ